MFLHTKVTLPVLRPFACCKKSLVIHESCGHHICTWSKDLIMDCVLMLKPQRLREFEYEKQHLFTRHFCTNILYKSGILSVFSVMVYSIYRNNCINMHSHNKLCIFSQNHTTAITITQRNYIIAVTFKTIFFPSWWIRTLTAKSDIKVCEHLNRQNCITHLG